MYQTKKNGAEAVKEKSVIEVKKQRGKNLKKKKTRLE